MDERPRSDSTKAFTIQVLLTNDPWAVREKVSPDTLSHLAWGYGWGLETNGKGEVISAFHTGDMNEWRSGVKLDLVAKQATVLFTKSTHGNGHVLQEQVFGQSHALDYFFDKFKFARCPEELRNDWREIRGFGIRKETNSASQANEGHGAVQRHDNSMPHMQVGKNIPPKPSQSTTALLQKSIASTVSMNNIPEWTINLVNQIIHALRNYYCLPDKFSAYEIDFKKSLIEAFDESNKRLHNSSKPPSSKEEYQPYLDALNKAMQQFDSHLAIGYGKEFISDRKRLNQFSQNKLNNTARFDFGDGPPPSDLAEIIGQIHNDLILRIPYACSINPTSKTNWEDQEMKGVQPDIEVNSKDALKVAIRNIQFTKQSEVASIDGKSHPTPFDMELKRK